MPQRKQSEPLEYEQLSLSGFRVEKGYYTTREVSELYSVSQHTVIDWIKRGWVRHVGAYEIPAFKQERLRVKHL